MGEEKEEGEKESEEVGTDIVRKKLNNRNNQTNQNWNSTFSKNCSKVHK